MDVLDDGDIKFESTQK